MVYGSFFNQILYLCFMTGDFPDGHLTHFGTLKLNNMFWYLKSQMWHHCFSSNVATCPRRWNGGYVVCPGSAAIAACQRQTFLLHM